MLPSPRVGGALSGALIRSIVEVRARVKRERVGGGVAKGLRAALRRALILFPREGEMKHPAQIERSTLPVSVRALSMVDAARLLLAGACLSLLLSGASACANGLAAPILLFDGVGTSPGDVAAVERILKQNDLSFATANSRQLNAMSESQLRAYRLLIVPGGNFEQIGNNLTASTAANVRSAVHHGLNYVGICAGAFF